MSKEAEAALVRSLLAWHGAFEHLLQGFLEVHRACEGEPNSTANIDKPAIAVSDDGPEREADRPAVLSALGYQIRSDSLNVITVKNLERRLAECNLSGRGHAFLPNLARGA